jgi:hypothetical protein
MAQNAALLKQKITIHLKDGTCRTGIVSSENAESIVLLTDDGGGNVYYINMTLDDQKKFNFDREQFVQNLMADNERLSTQVANLESQLEAMTASGSSRPTQISTNGSWVQVETFTGSSEKRTEPFTIISDRWRVKWSFTASEAAKELMSHSTGDANTYAMLGAKAVSEDNPKKDDQEILSAKIGSGTDKTEMRGSGTWSIQITSANSNWALTIEEYR